jgi:mono/diheme cytochrome c family protein
MTKQLRPARSPLYKLLWPAIGFAACTALPACNDSDDGPSGSDGPGITVNPNMHASGDPLAGREVFRFETFGNEGFWTDAARLPQGLIASAVTPLELLEAGIQLDFEVLPFRLQENLRHELASDHSHQNAPLLNCAEMTPWFINANALIGLPAKDTDGDGTIDVAQGDKMGVSCALCHAITDASAFEMTEGGSVGRRLDGRANHELDFGRIAAFAANSRALYPLLQLSLEANGGATLGRAPAGLTETSTEAEVDAYLTNPDFYPVGMFDKTLDGNGDPVHNAPLFRADLAAPWGSEGSISRLDNFSNLVYTALLDPTLLTTVGGRATMRRLGGDSAGDEIVDEYVAILAETGVTGYPFVAAEEHDAPGSEEALFGVRVDETKLVDLNGYLDSLQAPPGAKGPADAIARGLAHFRNDCTQCHNSDQSVFVPPFVVEMRHVWPGDDPVVLLERESPLSPILDSPGFYDDKMAVVNASLRGLVRGAAMPVLLDLERKPAFLHDQSVASLDALLDPARGPLAPHPFYVADLAQRADVIHFLNSLSAD